MRLTIEKVLVLNSVSIFAGVPEEDLVSVATAAKEIELTPATTVFERGDVGSCLYVIVDGRVRVHNGDRTIAHLGAREVFGELAALDPEVRSATVTTVEDTTLLRIEQRSIDELMADRPEVAKAIIRVLCQRLRKAAQTSNA